VSADQFSTVVDKEKYFCDNDTSNVDTEAEEMTATGAQNVMQSAYFYSYTLHCVP